MPPMPVTPGLVDQRTRFWASPGVLVGLVALSVLCLAAMHPFSVGGGPELDLVLSMTKAERLAKIAAWNASGAMNTVVFYALDCVWSGLWNSFFYALFHRVVKVRPGLLSWRAGVSALLISIFLVDAIENAGIVSLAIRYPMISTLHDGAVRGLTALKWAGISGFLVLLAVGFFQRTRRAGVSHD